MFDTLGIPEGKATAVYRSQVTISFRIGHKKQQSGNSPLVYRRVCWRGDVRC